LVETAWRLGAVPGLEELKLRRWAHMLGYRGHFATKSRSYSVTFTVLRERREAFAALVRFAALGVRVPVDDVVVLGEWRYAGRGVAVHLSSEPVGGCGAATRRVEIRILRMEESACIGHAERREDLKVLIKDVFEYGYRRVHAALARRGVQAGLELVRALMRELDLVACQPRPWRLTTTVAGDAGAIPDLAAAARLADWPAPVSQGDDPGLDTVGAGP
jgi:hypothetical protein